MGLEFETTGSISFEPGPYEGHLLRMEKRFKKFTNTDENGKEVVEDRSFLIWHFAIDEEGYEDVTLTAISSVSFGPKSKARRWAGNILRKKLPDNVKVREDDLKGHPVVLNVDSEEVIRSRGYWTCTDPEELVDLGFNKKQRRTPCLVIPVRSVNQEVLFHRIRPYDPRPDAKKAGKVIKYDQPAGVPVALDVPPLAHEDLLDRTRRLWIVEGEKKADALVSRGECAVALLGVWNWKKDGQMLFDWDQIPLMGREVMIAFDSDAVANYQVRLAEDALAKALEGRMGYVG